MNEGKSTFSPPNLVEALGELIKQALVNAHRHRADMEMVDLTLGTPLDGDVPGLIQVLSRTAAFHATDSHSHVFGM
ncbi:MAG: hypothetical protein AAFU79_34120, partial [Myxococcota bacterium]